jgi:hypothetical protein
MIKMILSLAMFIISFSLHAQSDQFTNLDQFLFPEFSKAGLKMKTGTDMTLILNYNTLTQNMVLLKNGQLYDMQNQESVDTVYLHNRKFIPFGKLFYEVIVNAPVPFFIQYKSNLRETGTPAGYGVTSTTSSSTYVTSFEHSDNYYNLKLPPKFQIKLSPVCWVRINGNNLSFITERQLLKIFPDQAEEIKQFIRGSKLRIENREDLIKIGIFCNNGMK